MADDNQDPIVPGAHLDPTSPSRGPLSPPSTASGIPISGSTTTSPTGKVSNQSNYLTPWGAAAGLVEKGVDTAANAANYTGGVGTSGLILTPQEQAANAGRFALPTKEQAAEGAVGNVGQIQQETAVPIEEANDVVKQQRAAGAQNQEELQKSLTNFNNVLQQKQQDMDSVRTELAQNPQAAVQKQYFGTPTNAIMSSLAMVLGGMGSGLSGQSNAALDMYNNQVKNAIDMRSQNIQGYLASAQQNHLGAEQQLSKAQLVALSNNISTIEMNHMQDGVIQGQNALATAKSAPQTAKILQLKMAADTANAEAGITSILATHGTTSNAQSLNGLGQMFAKIPGGWGTVPTLKEAIQQRYQKSGSTNGVPNSISLFDTSPDANSPTTSYSAPPSDTKPSFLKKLAGLEDSPASEQSEEGVFK